MKKGDRVRLVTNYLLYRGLPKGSLATYLGSRDFRFDKNHGGHGCGFDEDECIYGHGWCVGTEHFVVINDNTELPIRKRKPIHLNTEE